MSMAVASRNVSGHEDREGPREMPVGLSRSNIGVSATTDDSCRRANWDGTSEASCRRDWRQGWESGMLLVRYRACLHLSYNVRRKSGREIEIQETLTVASCTLESGLRRW